jgi:enterochelin esterase-like enzyme
VGLTSPALMVLMGVIAAGTLAAILCFWPKLAGHGVVPVLLRIGALSVLQLSVLALIFLIVNSSAEFYSSWPDLLGTQSGGGAIVAGRAHASHAAGAGQSIAPVTVLASSAVPVPGQPKAPAGELQAVRFYGALSGLTVDGYVYLPPGYGAKGEAPLPVAVVISAQLNSSGDAYSAGQLAATAARQIASKSLRPLIVVMLPDAVGQRDEGCLNVPGGSQAAMFFTEDLPQAVGSAYRAAPPTTTRWALVGDSSGGYCALQLAMTNSETFAVAAVPPGTYAAPPGPAASGGSPQIGAQDDLSWLLGHQPMQPISVLFTGPGSGQPFLSHARPPMHAGQIGLDPGKWHLAGVLDWVGSALQQPLASRS